LAASFISTRPVDANTRSHSRGMICPRFAVSLSLFFERGRRESREPTAPVAPRAKEKHAGWNYRFSRDIPAFPAQWCYGFLRALRGSGLSCPRCPRETLANVAPGSRRQDHTTSPSTAGVFVRATCIVLTPAAAIASCAQRFVTIAKRPSGGLRVAATHFRFTELSSIIRIRRRDCRRAAQGPAVHFRFSKGRARRHPPPHEGPTIFPSNQSGILPASPGRTEDA
jgi:hypothetical protein